MSEKIDPVDPYAAGNYEAPQGQVWVCAACGKQSKDKYGFKKISHGWDESCMMNAMLCYSEKSSTGAWVIVHTPTEERL